MRRTKRPKAPYPGVMFLDSQPARMNGYTASTKGTIPACIAIDATTRPTAPVANAPQSLRVEVDAKDELKISAGAKPHHFGWFPSGENFVVLLFAVIFPFLILLTYYHYIPNWMIVDHRMYVSTGGVLSIGDHWFLSHTMIKEIPLYEYSGYQDGDTLNAVVMGLDANMTAHFALLNIFDRNISGLWSELEEAVATGNVTVWRHGLFAIEMGLKVPKQNLVELVDNLRLADVNVQNIIGRTEIEAKRVLQDIHRIGDYGPDSIKRSESQLRHDKEALKALVKHSRAIHSALDSVIHIFIIRRDAERNLFGDLQRIQSQFPQELDIDAALGKIFLSGIQRQLYTAVREFRERSNVTTVLPFKWV